MHTEAHVLCKKNPTCRESVSTACFDKRLHYIIIMYDVLHNLERGNTVVKVDVQLWIQT